METITTYNYNILMPIPNVKDHPVKFAAVEFVAVSVVVTVAAAIVAAAVVAVAVVAVVLPNFALRSTMQEAVPVNFELES